MPACSFSRGCWIGVILIACDDEKWMMFRLSTAITDHPAVSHWETSSSLHGWQRVQIVFKFYFLSSVKVQGGIIMCQLIVMTHIK